MNIALFYHSLLSDWNHGNAHFLRGVATELISRGHNVSVYEPENSWSYSNLVNDYGEKAVEEFYRYYPQLQSIRYTKNINLHQTLRDCDLVLVHEWNEHWIVQAIGEEKKRSGFKLLFHDTHHRAVTDRKSVSKYDLRNYDGVLAYGEVIRKIYLDNSWIKKAWTWHEAADTRVFKPMIADREGDLVWIGNWGDDERTKELYEYLIEPARALGLKTRLYGVRYPAEAKRALLDAGIEYGGWLPNYKVPEVFAKYTITIHVPRGPYVESLPGIPTIRPFEALACGIPMISSPWNDSEHLFNVGSDFLVVNNGDEMKDAISGLLADESLRESLKQSGLRTIYNRHTCSHRVDELLTIYEQLSLKKISTQPIVS
jgi:spore maturation protein CgeB